MRTRNARLFLALATGAAATAAALVPAAASVAATPSSAHLTITDGLPDGAVKHTWLIILENKSYDATFSGLNQNSYLWKTLTGQGALLTNYYGTSHFSQGNYETLVSGQATNTDLNSDCDVAYKDFGGSVVTDTSSPNYGQSASAAGPYKGLTNDPAGDGKNGCVFPKNVPTLFNQFDAAKVSWKGYAQDLGAQAGREDTPCGGPGTSSNDPTSNPTNEQGTKPTGVSSYTGAQANDQYVAKHFPFPWFHSLTDNAADCDANHVTSLDNASTGLVHDLQTNNVPAFSWITPNNCSDAHDATCVGNNLSGAFNSDGSPNYQTPTPYNPQSVAATNSIGGLYASDKFLQYYVPLIESSSAFKDGGLIDITFDEGNPPFTYTGNSFNNATDYPGTSGANATNADMPNYKTGLDADRTQFTINGTVSTAVPAGPNNPLGDNGTTGGVNTEGHPYPGPGNNAFIDRVPAPARTDAGATAPAGSTVVTDNGNGRGSTAISVLDKGRAVTGTNIPAGAFVGAVTDVGPDFANNRAVDGSFLLVDSKGAPVQTTGAVTGITLAARTTADDPLYDNVDQTSGGGNTGSVLISPFIKPGTTSAVSYNHYSWLRTMEDVYGVAAGTSTATIPGGAGSVSGGLDGQGHLGYAALPGLAGFGPDVFTNAPAVVTAAPSTSASATTPAAGGGSATGATGATATGAAPAALPFTGSRDVGGLLAVGLLLTGVGGVTTVVARRRMKV